MVAELLYSSYVAKSVYFLQYIPFPVLSDQNEVPQLSDADVSEYENQPVSFNTAVRVSM